MYYGKQKMFQTTNQYLYSKFQTFRMTPPNMKCLCFSIISPCVCTFFGGLDPLTHVTPFSNPHFRRAALCRQLWRRAALCRQLWELEQLVAPGTEEANI